MDERELRRRLRAEIDSIAVPDATPARRRPIARALPLLAAVLAVLVVALAAGRLLSVLREDRSDVAAPTSTAVASVPPPTATPGSARPVPLTVLAPPDGWREPLHGLSDRPGIVIITTPHDIALLLGAPGGKLADSEVGTLLNGVDYVKQVVFAVFAGTKPCLGFQISVQEVRVDLAAQVELRTTQTGPGPYDVCLTAVSYPMQLIVVDRDAIPLSTRVDVRATNPDGSVHSATIWCAADLGSACVTSALQNGAAVQRRVTQMTIEGDPIISLALIRASGPSKVVRDMRADRFAGVGNRRVFVYMCNAFFGSSAPGLTFKECEGDGDSVTIP